MPAACGRTAVVVAEGLDGTGSGTSVGTDTSAAESTGGCEPDDAPGDEVEPNDAPETAQMLSLPAQLGASLDGCDDPGLAVRGDAIEDLYTLEFSEPGLLLYGLSDVDLDVDPSVYVLGTGYSLLSSTDDAGANLERVIVPITYAGKAWIAVSQPDTAAPVEGAYLLSAERCGVETPPLERDGCASGPTEVSIPTPTLSGPCRADEVSITGVVSSGPTATEIVEGLVMVEPGAHEIVWGIRGRDDGQALEVTQQLTVRSNPNC